MKVIFLEDVAGTADAGEIKEVKNGFARNYLLPRKMAAPATADQLQRTRSIEKAAKEKRLKFSQEWGDVAGLLEGTVVPVEVRVGPNGRLFGSVTGRHIADRLSEVTGRSIDHRQVLLGATIHEPGEYPVTIRLYREVTAEVNVLVVPEGYVAQQAEETDEDEGSEEPQDEVKEESTPAEEEEATEEEEES